MIFQFDYQLVYYLNLSSIFENFQMYLFAGLFFYYLRKDLLQTRAPLLAKTFSDPKLFDYLQNWDHLLLYVELDFGMILFFENVYQPL